MRRQGRRRLRPNSRAILAPAYRLQVLVAGAVLGLLLVAQPPQARGEDGLISEVSSLRPQAAAETPTPAPAIAPPLPTPVPSVRVSRDVPVLFVHTGPGELYPVIGTAPPGSVLEVVGRDISGLWLAIVFTSGSGLYAWVPRAAVIGLESSSGSLTVLPARLLPQ